MSAEYVTTPARAGQDGRSCGCRGIGHTGKCRALASRQRRDAARQAREQALADAAGVQPGLFSRAPRVDAEDVQVLLDRLFSVGWMSARRLGELYGYRDRTLRALAAASGGRIISGQRGYRTIWRATVEEVDRAEAWLRSQAVKMLQRAYEIRRARNRAA